MLEALVRSHPHRLLLLRGDRIVAASQALVDELSRKRIKEPLLGRSVKTLSWLRLSHEAAEALDRPSKSALPVIWDGQTEIPGLVVANNILVCVDPAPPGTFLLCITDRTADWIVDTVPEVVAVSSGYEPARFRYVSSGIEAWTGLPAERFMEDGKLFFKMIHPEDRPGVESRFASLDNSAEGKTIGLICRMTHVSGGVVWIRISGVCSKHGDGEGGLLHLFTMSEVTEQIERERELQQSAQRYGLLHEHGPLGILCIDRTGKVVDCNRRLADLLGLEPEDVLEVNLLNYSHPVLRDVVKSVLRGHTVERREIFLHPSSGQELFISVRAFPLKTHNGPVIGGYAFIEDVTQAVEMEKRLEEEKRFHEAVVESAGIIVAAVDRFGFIKKTNSILNSLVGVLDGAELAGRLFWEVMVAESEQNRFVEGMKECLRDNISFQLETRLRPGDGERLISWRISPLPNPQDPEGEPGTYLITGTDITSLKRLEDQLRASQKMEAIGRLAGGIAHDFNNQLTAILGYCQMMQMEVEPGTRLHGQLEIVEKAARRAAETTNQLLAFSRKQMLQPRLVSMNKLVMDSTVLFERLIGESIEIRYELSATDAVVEVDPGQFQQILLNLALNARDAMPEGGKLIIRTAVKSLVAIPGKEFGGSGTYACIDVQDTGIGMEKEVLDKAFEPFFTTKPVGQGTGLGLSMVYGTVKQSGGYVFIDSRKGEGTTVHILLPIVEGQLPDEDVEAGSEASALVDGSGARVLVVEDEMLVLHLVNNFLEKLGFSVTSFSDPEEALGYLEGCDEAGRPVLLLTDLILPKMTGRELAAKARDMIPGLKVLYMSGYSAEMITKHGLLPGDTTFLQKPFTLAQFSQKMRMILGD